MCGSVEAKYSCWEVENSHKITHEYFCIIKINGDGRLSSRCCRDVTNGNVLKLLETSGKRRLR